MGARILVVDDEEPILYALREYFTAFGFEVDSAPGLPEARELLAQNRYDVAIADLRLAGSPGVEGLEVVALARAANPSVKVILLTAYGSPEVEAEARRLGVDAFLHKPKPLPEVAQLVRSLLARSP